MARVPAFCRQCGAVFPSGISVSNIKNLSLLNNRQRCPFCGGWADIPDGRYDVVDDVIKLLAGPAISHDLILRYYEVIRESLESSHSPEEAVDRVGRRLPDVGEWLAKALPPHRKWLLGILGAALGLLVSAQIASGPTADEIESAFYSALQRHAAEQAGLNQGRQ